LYASLAKMKNAKMETSSQGKKIITDSKKILCV